MALRIVDRLQALGYSKNVYTCDTKSVRCYSQDVRGYESHFIYDSELLFSEELDQYAMKINHIYSGGKSMMEDWKKCGYFERMSSRASIDYLMPLICKISNNPNEISLNHNQIENLAKSEHLRWCAFHYTFGFDVMKKEDFINRIKDYKNELREYGKSEIRITKDKEVRKNACLVKWDELDEISKIENFLLSSDKYDEKESLRRWINTVIKLMRDNYMQKNEVIS